LREIQLPVQIAPKLFTPANAPLSRPRAQPANYSPLLPKQASIGEQLSRISTQFSSVTGAAAAANM